MSSKIPVAERAVRKSKHLLYAHFGRNHFCYLCKLLVKCIITIFVPCVNIVNTIRICHMLSDGGFMRFPAVLRAHTEESGAAIQGHALTMKAPGLGGMLLRARMAYGDSFIRPVARAMGKASSIAPWAFQPGAPCAGQTAQPKKLRASGFFLPRNKRLNRPGTTN